MFLFARLIISSIFLWNYALFSEMHPLVADDLGAFLDGFIPLQIGKEDIAGTVVTVVKDGEILFSKGYGYADVANKIPISPEMTLFRPGSISKLFIWTAVMQQVEQGKIDLDRDVNDYLDFKIPASFGKPITMRDLMTHRPGFEESTKDLMVNSSEELTPLAQYLQAHMPAQIIPPGTIPAYSNYGSTLAAYILERISGKDFNTYVEENILKPLNMDRSTFRQPLPEKFKASMSNGYKLGSGDPKPFELLQPYPVGSLTASAHDMAHFMIMQLQQGHYGTSTLLQPETVTEMHARQAGWPDGMNAMCLGFYEQSQNGYRVIAHGGDTDLFHSVMYLILDARVGIFISYNSSGKGEVEPRSVLFSQFMDRYLPNTLEKKKTETSSDLNAFTGDYELSRRFETNILAMTSMLGEANVFVNAKDNTLSVSGVNGLDNQPLHFQQIAPQQFQDVNGKSKLAFVNDVLYSDAPFMVYQKVNSILDKKSVNYLIMGFILSTTLLTLLAWPLGALMRKHYAKPLTLDPKAKKLKLITLITCFLILIFAVGFLLLLNSLYDLPSITSKKDATVHLLQGVGVLAALTSLLAIYYGIRSWTDSQQWFWAKIWNTLIVLACIAFIWFIYHWHLLNFNLNY